MIEPQTFSYETSTAIGAFATVIADLHDLYTNTGTGECVFAATSWSINDATVVAPKSDQTGVIFYQDSGVLQAL